MQNPSATPCLGVELHLNAGPVSLAWVIHLVSSVKIGSVAQRKGLLHQGTPGVLVEGDEAAAGRS